MDIRKPSIDIGKLLGRADRLQMKKEETAMAFEKLFARQLVSQMTEGLFKGSEDSMMNAGGDVYRDHIVDTLSSELAQQEKLGMSELVRRYWEQRSGGDSGSGGAPANPE
ncbi:MAG: hypothetical protein U5K31_09230 [Balneolaceae bacterium]|nr:hypothetical protein [Balneolaceae bacterium]